MAQQTIDIGSTANDGTGTSLRSSFDICNDNFSELYAKWGQNVALASDYGIETGETTTQVVKINTAIDALSAAGGGTLKFGPGIYFLSSGGTSITPKSNVRVVGSGMGVTILKAGSGQSQSLVRGDTFTADAPLENWCMESLTLDATDCLVTGGVGNSVSGGAKGTFILWQRNCHYKHVEIKNSPSTGMGNDFHQNCTYIDCHVTGCGRAQRQTARDAANPHAATYGIGCHGFGIGYCGWDNEFVIFERCVASNNWNAGFSQERVLPAQGSYDPYLQYRRSSKMIMHNCISHDNERYGFEINDVGYRNEIYGGDIVGCKAFNNGRDGILIWNAPRNCNVERNLVHDNGWCGINLPGRPILQTSANPYPRSESHDIRIRGNQVWGHISDGDARNQGWGILCKAPNVQIHDNNVHHNYRGGIGILDYGRQVENVEVYENDIWDESLTATGRFIALDFTTDYNHRRIFIKDNTLRDSGALEFPITSSTIDFVSITDETVRIEKGQGLGLYKGQTIDVSGFTGAQSDANTTGAVITDAGSWWIEYTKSGASDYARAGIIGGAGLITRVPKCDTALYGGTTVPVQNLVIEDNRGHGLPGDGCRVTIGGSASSSHHRFRNNRFVDNAGWGAIYTFTNAGVDCEFTDNFEDNNAEGGLLFRGSGSGTISNSIVRENYNSATFTPNGGTGNKVGSTAATLDTADWLISQIAGTDEIRIANKGGLSGYLRLDSASNFLQWNNLAEIYTSKAVSGATPNISGTRLARLSNGSPTNVTSLSGATAYQLVCVEFADANSTLVHSANLVLRSGANETPAANAAKMFLINSSGSVAREV